MTEKRDALEEGIWELCRQAKEIEVPPDILPSVLKLLQTRRCRLALGYRLGPILSFIALSLLFLRLFTFSPGVILNLVRIFLLFLSLATGTVFLFQPEKMIEIDRKILGDYLLKFGPKATPFQEEILFRVQAIYFILIGFIICRI